MYFEMNEFTLHRQKSEQGIQYTLWAQITFPSTKEVRDIETSWQRSDADPVVENEILKAINKVVNSGDQPAT